MNEPNDLEKTRFKARADANSQEQDNQTRIAPAKQPVNSPDAAPLQPIAATPDATVVNPDISAANSAFTDKTRFAPQRSSAERPAQKPDQTRFAPAKKVPATAKQTSSASTANQGDGNLLKGRFILEELLGAGGMGVVYKAKDLLKIEAQDRDPYVAIKVLTDEFKSHPEAFIALQRESRKTQRIAHPNIVTVFDFDRDGDTVFMTMEYLDGKPLDKLIAQYRAIGMPQDEVYKILEGICAALIYAHGQNIIHSDFKPGNIFVSTKGVAKVIDFGIARAVARVEHREESTEDKTVFDAGNLGALTPAYASLEMLEGKIPDVRDDIYALGCIAYELFTGVHPFNRVHADEAKRQKLKPKRITGIKKHQWRAIEQALAFDREQRIQSVEVFWGTFSTKPKSALGLVASVLIIGALAAGGYYQYLHLQKPQLSEAQVRNQIEQKLRLELLQKSFDELYSQASFSPEWEDQIWSQVQDLRALTIDDENWLPGREKNLFNLYVSQIRQAIGGKDLDNAQRWLGNAPRYGKDQQLLASLDQSLKQAQEDERQRKLAEDARQQAELAERQQQEKVRAEQQKQQAETKRVTSEFNVALDNVNEQLSCRSSIDMKDFEIAISKLRSLNASRYQSEEAGIVQSLAGCIKKIGLTFPDRAEVIKRQAMRLFVRNDVLAKISIAPRDPCNQSLAGLGARGLGTSCRDKLAGATKAPYLVVVPAKGSIPAFAIGKYEISNDEMGEFCRDSKSCNLSSSNPSLPATNLTTDQMNNYVKWLSEKSGHQYRLPSLAEWQYAARATSATPDPNRNCKLNSRGIQKGGTLVKTTLGQQNPWGLVNHLGNAQEVVLGRGGAFIVVGGSYETDMADCTFSNQVSFSSAQQTTSGFRVLREISSTSGG